MKNLVITEFFKLKKSTAYKALLTIYLITEAIVQINNISNSVVYPKYNPSYTGAEFLLDSNMTVLLYSVALFLFTAFYVNGDFTAHTFYSSLLCGIPRKNAFWAKMAALLAGAVPLMLIASLTGTALWSIHSGFGMGLGAEAALLVAKAFAKKILLSLMLISHTVFFAVIVKSKISAFVLSFSTLYLVNILRAVVANMMSVSVLSKCLLFLLSLFYLNIGTFLASVLLKFLVARYIFERTDFK